MSPEALPSELWYQDSTVCSLCVFVGGAVRVLPPQVLPSELYHDSTVLSLLRRGGEPVPSPVHRLGVGTSGLLLCAASALGRRALSVALQERRVSKTYRALVQGLVAGETLDIDCPIGPVPHAAAFGGSCGEVCAARPEGGAGCKAARSHLAILQWYCAQPAHSEFAPCSNFAMMQQLFEAKSASDRKALNAKKRPVTAEARAEYLAMYEATCVLRWSERSQTFYVPIDYVTSYVHSGRHTSESGGSTGAVRPVESQRRDTTSAPVWAGAEVRSNVAVHPTSQASPPRPIGNQSLKSCCRSICFSRSVRVI